MVLLLIVSSFVDYISGILIDKKHRKLGLYFSVFFNLGILIYFKYSNFIIQNLNEMLSFTGASVSLKPMNVLMPLGISFFTFQTMSYTIDVYRGKVKACYSFLDFITYVTLFPQLVAGPIVRYEEIQEQLKNKNVSISRFSYGIERFVKGLFKKLFIANNLVLVANIAFETQEGYGTLFSWIGIICYTLYVYYDVSGYADMAIGLGKIFGFDFPENFNYPYIANSIRDFWRRWHITMSTWFRDYVYISMGGNRKSKNRVLFNLLVVFGVTGLWHGAAWNFLIWGLWHGVFLLLERQGVLNFVPKKIRHIYVILVVILGLVIFRANNITHAINYIEQMFVYKPLEDFNLIRFSFRYETIVAFIFSLLFSFPLYKKLKILIKKLINKQEIISVLRIVTITVMLLVCYTYIAIGAYNPFIYFKF
ncbi:alginate O-acetyltransferase complex protein AlgI [Wenyingzhuangia heitensis]|uniref:Alginate O-acetyltransferase complex protein AlgI n=1 Tax=Wenyingzhuangia heitensis TaxID=1487859 RepID=A0ABX0U9Q6_9FLAO|nr:MBOAT family O-acyltransferase [Wenyingzhuangia heitensis]NIJ43876.1 alginate O-acetyltransferase complex protein AlgI [Wenyingzhuangia heitensis]